MSWVRRSAAGVLVAVLALTTASCGGDSGGEVTEIRMAKQFGIGYTPLTVLEHRPKILKKHLPGVELTWKQLGAGTSIRDAMLADELDVGSGGAGPVIDGLTKGVEFSIATGLVEMPMWAVAPPSGPKKLTDIGKGGKIALPGINSSQHVVLREALKRQGADPKKLDSNLVPMPHPDGLSSFKAKQIAAHVTSAPFQYQEMDAGGTKLADSFELWGEHTFMTVYATQDFAEENPKTFKGLVKAVEEAITWTNSHKKETAEILAEESAGETPAKEYLAQLNEPTVQFSAEIKNIKPMADAMYDLGFIEKEVTADQLFFDTANFDRSKW